MLHPRKALCIFLMALLLAQPVFAETEAVTQTPTQPPEPDIITAVRSVDAIPEDFTPASAPAWLLELTAAPLYAVTEDGNWQPVLARALPEDVTEKYAGIFGIPTDAQRGYAFRILLDPDARWEDGMSITAGDCISSIKALLQSEETAKDFLFLARAAAILSKKPYSGSDIISLGEAGFASVHEAWSAGHTEFFVDTEGFWGLGGGWRSVSDRTRLRDFAMPGGLDEFFVSPAYLYNNYLMSGAQSNHYQKDFIGIYRTPGKAFTMADLGLIRVNNHELILITEEASTASMVMERLDMPFLYREKEGKPLSYGPYRTLSSDPASLLLEANPNWWHAPDPRGYDRILCQKIGT